MILFSFYFKHFKVWICFINFFFKSTNLSYIQFLSKPCSFQVIKYRTCSFTKINNLIRTTKSVKNISILKENNNFSSYFLSLFFFVNIIFRYFSIFNVIIYFTKSVNFYSRYVKTYGTVSAKKCIPLNPLHRNLNLLWLLYSAFKYTIVAKSVINNSLKRCLFWNYCDCCFKVII